MEQLKMVILNVERKKDEASIWVSDNDKTK